MNVAAGNNVSLLGKNKAGVMKGTGCSVRTAAAWKRLRPTRVNTDAISVQSQVSKRLSLHPVTFILERLRGLQRQK